MVHEITDGRGNNSKRRLKDDVRKVYLGFPDVKLYIKIPYKRQRHNSTAQHIPGHQK